MSRPEIVLLVEDDPDIREDLAFLIEHRGYQVVTAEHGKRALEKLRAGSGLPCIIVLDLMMPVMDGWELCAELQRKPDLAEVPVVLVSGVADLEQEAQALDAVGYLTKPLELPRLFDLLEAHC